MRLDDSVTDIRCIRRFNTLEEHLHKIHNNKYDYSKLVYKGNRYKAIIICPKHGEFEQRMETHIKGGGCIKCSFEAKSESYKDTKEQYLQKAEKVHGNNYDYSLINYEGTFSKLDIICPKHGIFKQTATDHLQGRGCPKCGILKSIKTKGIPQDVFFKLIPEHLKDYKFVNLPDNLYKKAKIEILCHEHGVFIKSVEKFLSSEGCPKCVHKKNSEQKITPFNIWFENVKEVHKGLYTYPQNIQEYYYNGKSKVPVICSEHGEWFAIAKNHLKGSGCPACNSFKRGYYIDKVTLFYIIKINNLYKIGITTKNNIKQRYSGECDHTKLDVLFEHHFVNGVDAYNLELKLKKKYKEVQYKGTPLFKFTGNSEIYTENIYDLEILNIKEYISEKEIEELNKQKGIK